jgi:hypothetical protein
MTANGMAGYAFEEWTNADSEFAKFFYPWFMNPEYHRPGLHSAGRRANIGLISWALWRLFGHFRLKN